MKKVLFALLALCAFQSYSFAGILGSGLTFNGIDDTLKDESVGLFYDLDTNGSLNTGDVIQGVIRLDETTPDGVGGIPLSSVYAVYSLEITGVGGLNVDLKPATGIYSISSIMGAVGLTTAGLTNPTGTLADAAFLVVEKAGETPLADLDANLANPANRIINTGTIGGVISAGNGWSTSLVAGLLGDDFYRIRLLDPTYLSLAALAGLDPDTQIAQYRAATSILFHNFGAAATFQSLVSDRDFTLGTDNRLGDIVTAGNNVISEPSDIATAGNWNFSDDGNFKLNGVIPEPTSLAVLAGLSTFGLLRSFRRRK